MQKLIDYKQNLKRGDVLRFPTSYPYEDYLEILLTELFHDNGRFGFVIISGQKAGLIFINLPAESELENEIGISKQWIIEHWDKWFGFCDVSDANIIFKC